MSLRNVTSKYDKRAVKAEVRIVETDALFFRLHPYREFRCREATLAELAANQNPTCTWTLVKRLTPTKRFRFQVEPPSWARPFTPKNLSEHVVAQLFASVLAASPCLREAYRKAQTSSPSVHP